jgi:hypothetical protein
MMIVVTAKILEAAVGMKEEEMVYSAAKQYR